MAKINKILSSKTIAHIFVFFAIFRTLAESAILSRYMPSIVLDAIDVSFCTYFILRFYLVYWTLLNHKKQTIAAIVLLATFIYSICSRDLLSFQLIVAGLSITGIKPISNTLAFLLIELLMMLIIATCFILEIPLVTHYGLLIFFILLASRVFTPHTAKEIKARKISLTDLQKIQFSMLKEFAKYCDNNNIKYALCGGTLLGAIRHKGFIPWDDDIDILVSRPDFEKLQRIKKPTIATDLSISNRRTGSSFPFIKIYNPNYKIYEENIDLEEGEYIWIDVFPADGLPDKEKDIKKLYKKVTFFRKLLMQKLLRNDCTISSSKNKVKQFFKPLSKYFIDFLPIDFYLKKLDDISQSYTYAECNNVGGVMWGYGPQEKMPKEDFEKRVKVSFEGQKFYTFSCWEKYLTNLYGNYLQLPPKSKRINHNIYIIEE